MSALAFLTPDAASGTVLARSPMEGRARAAGASIEPRAGWNVAASYAVGAQRERERLTQTVAFADRSDLIKLEVQAEPEALAAVIHAATGGAVVLEPRLAVRGVGAWWCPVTPSRALVLADAGADGEDRVRDAVIAAAADSSSLVSVIDVTSGLAALTLAGPGSGELVARFCAIDVRLSVTPVHGFRPGSVARTPGYLLREREDRLLVLVGWALGEYLWEVVADAAEHLGGGPVGADALEGTAALEPTLATLGENPDGLQENDDA
jgi:heterotetrameric sarcosine oxidase gamma subunit